jgi:hypothetical protein
VQGALTLRPPPVLPLLKLQDATPVTPGIVQLPLPVPVSGLIEAVQPGGIRPAIPIPWALAGAMPTPAINATKLEATTNAKMRELLNLE